jgi:N-acetylmuramoyl-L-alanine amidase
LPRIYLDPSTDEANAYVGGGNEEYYMNLIADAMVPYLNMAGIGFTRNNPNDTLNDIVEQSNAGNYDLHLSLRSTPADAIQLGPIIYYDTFRPEAQRVAYYIARSLWSIYPDPNLIEMVPNSTLSQIALTTAPTVIIDLVNPNNYEDTEWLRNNIYRIARMIVFGLTDYFKIPFDISREPVKAM